MCTVYKGSSQAAARQLACEAVQTRGMDGTTRTCGTTWAARPALCSPQRHDTPSAAVQHQWLGQIPCSAEAGCLTWLDKATGLPTPAYPDLRCRLAWCLSQRQTPCGSHLRFASALSTAATPHLLLCKVVRLVGHHILQAALPLRHALGGHHHAPCHPLLHHLRLVALHR